MYTSVTDSQFETIYTQIERLELLPSDEKFNSVKRKKYVLQRLIRYFRGGDISYSVFKL
jgi:hypothetical protein